jgi:hypothetical protein
MKAVKEFPQQPESTKRSVLVKWVKSFLGLTSFYRHYVPGFAEVAKPVMDLTKDQKLFIWEPVQQGRFEALKDTLANVAVLTHPDYNLPFEIHPDACGYRIGSVRKQRQDGAEKLLGFSRK